MKKLLTTMCLVGAFFIFPQAVCAETVFNGESVDVGEAGEYTYTSDNETVATVDKDGIVLGRSEGNTTIHVKEKKFLRWGDKKKIPITVVNGATLVISPLEETSLEPDFVLYDKDKKEVRHFTLHDELRLNPGKYFVKEQTKTSSFSDKYTEFDLDAGERKEICSMFMDTTTLEFKTNDSSLNGEEFTVWKERNGQYQKILVVTMTDGKTEPVELRSGRYYWTANAYCTETITVNGKEISASPFGVGGNPVTVEVSSKETASAVEAVSFSENTKENTKKIYDDLMAAGASPICASAIIGNMYGESGVRASAIENGGGGHGLCQWTGGRWHNLKAYADSVGKDWTDIDVQIDFLLGELNGYKMDEFWGSQSVEEATELFMRKFERPAEWVYATSLPKRIGAAKRVYESYAR